MAWIGVGISYPCSVNVWRIGAHNEKEENCIKRDKLLRRGRRLSRDRAGRNCFGRSLCQSNLEQVRPYWGGALSGTTAGRTLPAQSQNPLFPAPRRAVPESESKAEAAGCWEQHSPSTRRRPIGRQKSQNAPKRPQGGTGVRHRRITRGLAASCAMAMP